MRRAHQQLEAPPLDVDTSKAAAARAHSARGGCSQRLTWRSFSPPPLATTEMLEAPASMLFSSSSLSALAGRWITCTQQKAISGASPAAQAFHAGPAPLSQHGTSLSTRQAHSPCQRQARRRHGAKMHDLSGRDTVHRRLVQSPDRRGLSSRHVLLPSALPCSRSLGRLPQPPNSAGFPSSRRGRISGMGNETRHRTALTLRTCRR